MQSAAEAFKAASSTDSTSSTAKPALGILAQTTEHAGGFSALVGIGIFQNGDPLRDGLAKEDRLLICCRSGATDTSQPWSGKLNLLKRCAQPSPTNIGSIITTGVPTLCGMILKCPRQSSGAIQPERWLDRPQKSTQTAVLRSEGHVLRSHSEISD